MSIALLKSYFVLVVALIGCFILAQPVAASKRLLENWDSTPALDCLWRDGDFQRYVDTTNQELHLVVRPYAAKIDSDYCRERARTRFKDSDIITSIKATININKIKYTPEMIMTVAEINGDFYNTINGRVDNKGNVHVKIRFGDRGDGLEVWLALYESLDSESIDFTEEILSIVAPGTLELETSIDYQVTLEYDGDKTFSYRFTGGTIDKEGTVAGPDREDEPYYFGKALESRVYMKSPLKTNPDNNTIDVAYSDVHINGNAAAYDTFTTPLDNTLWRDPDSEARVIDLKLQMRVVSTTVEDQTATTNLPGQYAGYTFMQADLMLQGGIVPDGTRGVVNMKSNWGNGKHSNEGDWDGQISTYADVRKQTDNQYKACCTANMDDVDLPPYGLGFFSECVDASPDKFYTFSTELSGTVLSCTIKDTSTGNVLSNQLKDIKDFGIGTIYPINQRKQLRVRVRSISTPGINEAIGYFDNVYIDDGSNMLFQVLPAIITSGKEKQVISR